MRFLALILMVFCLSPLVAKAAETAYFSALPDIPVMPGLQEVPARTVVFDKAEGKVVETLAAVGQTRFSEVLAFYDESLKQLGWKAIKPGLFVRENEQLLVKLEQDAEGSFVRFFLTPNAREKF